MTTLLALIPMLPLSGFLILLFFGNRIENESHRVTLPLSGLSFIFSLGILFGVGRTGPIRLDLYPLIESGNLVVEFGLYADSLSSLLLVLVTGVGTLVQIFSSRYMQGDLRYPRFFAVTNLFTFAMVMLVLSTNLAALFIFWEIMGICSYLLISHYSERVAAAAAATRVFIVNAVADLGLALAIILTFRTFGTLDIQEVLARAPDYTGEMMSLLSFGSVWEWRVPTLTVIAMLFLLGAMGKSAQFPFHVWLPYAMEAPTPVSALIHAATLVKAGIFLLLRLSPLFVLAPAAMTLAMGVGMVTAVLAATVALTQTDIKKILAYSTMSQLGLMIMACGAGAYRAAVFHLLAHGAVKTYLFLGSGGALQGLSPHGHGKGPAGSPWKNMAGVLILAATPPLLIAFSGYAQLWGTGPGGFPSLLFWFITLGTSFLTGLYLVRGFIGKPETAGLTSRALFLLLGAAGLAVMLAWTWKGFSNFLGSALAQAPSSLPMGEGGTFLPLVILGLVAALGGIGLGLVTLHRNPASDSRWVKVKKWTYVAMQNRWYVDEIYDIFILRPILRLAHGLWETVDVRFLGRSLLGSVLGLVRFSRWLWLFVDVRVLGGLASGLGQLTFRLARWLWESVDIRFLGGVMDGPARFTRRLAGWLWKGADIRSLESFFRGIGQGTEEGGRGLREVEPSLLQHQLLLMIFFLILAMVVFLLL